MRLELPQAGAAELPEGTKPGARGHGCEADQGRGTEAVRRMRQAKEVAKQAFPLQEENAMKRIVGVCLLIILFLIAAARGDEATEVKRLAPKYGVTPENIEVRLSDGSWADMVGRQYVYEVEWAENHYEAPGQATWYSIVTGKRPAVILLIRDWEKSAKHIWRAKAICKRLKIKLYLESVNNKQ